MTQIYTVVTRRRSILTKKTILPRTGTFDDLGYVMNGMLTVSRSGAFVRMHEVRIVFFLYF